MVPLSLDLRSNCASGVFRLVRDLVDRYDDVTLDLDHPTARATGNRPVPFSLVAEVAAIANNN